MALVKFGGGEHQILVAGFKFFYDNVPCIWEDNSNEVLCSCTSQRFYELLNSRGCRVERDDWVADDGCNYSICVTLCYCLIGNMLFL